MKRSMSNPRTRLALGLATISAAAMGLTGLTLPAQASNGGPVPPKQVKLTMSPSNATLASCFPKARATVTVKLTTEKKGFDTVKIRTAGLKPNTSFTLFLLEQPGLPFGAAEYFGDFTTDKYGRASNSYDLIAEEAFAFNNSTQQRIDLNSIGFWFADEADDDSCLGVPGPVTGFDGDGKAGVQMMNSGANLLP